MATLVARPPDIQQRLDALARRPAFELAEPGAAGAITVRHLLTHASGIHGDYFEDFGKRRRRRALRGKPVVSGRGGR